MIKHVARESGVEPAINGGLQRRSSMGHITELDGSYHGEFLRRDGKEIKHGYGIKTFNDGSMYQGEWIEDVFHGNGTLVSPTGVYAYV